METPVKMIAVQFSSAIIAEEAEDFLSDLLLDKVRCHRRSCILRFELENCESVSKTLQLLNQFVLEKYGY